MTATQELAAWLRETMRLWLASIENDNTRRMYGGTLRTLAQFWPDDGSPKLVEPTQARLELASAAYYRTAQPRPGTYNLRIAGWLAWARYLHRHDLLPGPWPYLKRRTLRDEGPSLQQPSEAEIARAWDWLWSTEARELGRRSIQMRDRLVADRALWVVLAFCGLKTGEAGDLARVHWWLAKRGALRVQAPPAKRLIYLPTEDMRVRKALDDLCEGRDADEPLFPFGTSAIRGRVQLIWERAGVVPGYPPRSLRDYVCTQLARRNETPETIQHLMGYETRKGVQRVIEHVFAQDHAMPPPPLPVVDGAEAPIAATLSEPLEAATATDDDDANPEDET